MNTEEIEKKVYELIVKMTRQKLSKELGMDHRTMMTKLKRGGWLKSEMVSVNQLYEKHGRG